MGIGDETGCITLLAKNEQIDILKDTEEIILTCKAEMHQGYLRAVVDKQGSLHKASGNVNIINYRNNLSDLEYHLICSDGKQHNQKGTYWVGPEGYWYSEKEEKTSVN